MKKQIMAEADGNATAAHEPWLDLDACASVKLTSENHEHPIESALYDGAGKGWVAGSAGPQTIWLHFDHPQRIRDVYLRFERATPVTQEFALSWSDNDGVAYRELVRQQFNFSDQTQCEEENLHADLTGVTDMKLTIIPDINGGESLATLQALRLA